MSGRCQSVAGILKVVDGECYRQHRMWRVGGSVICAGKVDCGCRT